MKKVVTLNQYIKIILVLFTLSVYAIFAQNQPQLFEQSVTFSSSNLPIIVITTENGAVIGDEPKIMAHMGIIANGKGKRNNLTDPFNHYDGYIGIELRGNASQDIFPKKPYTIETRDEKGVNLNVSLLGMPKENDWILRAAYIDKTLLRDAFAYNMSRLMGNWASRTVHCELVLNDEYQGIYILMESIKPDKNRVNITKMDSSDISGDAVTGGYIYEVAQDGPGFGRRCRFKYPKADDIRPEQIAYIKNYDDSFRSIMYKQNYADPITGYPVWIDVNSFIDKILVQEACRNSDAYGWSSQFHKDRLGKFKAGPVWDFDQALSNSTFNNGYEYTHWIIENDYPEVLADHPFFWKKLFAEPKFKSQLSQRWFELRAGPFRTDSLLQYIDDMAQYLNEARQRNFQKWPILGVEIWRSTPGAESRNTYQKEINYMKNWLEKRLQWMDEELEPFYTSLKEPNINKKIDAFQIHAHPNPFHKTTFIQYSLQIPGQIQISIYNILGQKIHTLINTKQSNGHYIIPWDGHDKFGNPVAKGSYFCTININNNIIQCHKLVKL